jgi:hypothetical protein
MYACMHANTHIRVCTHTHTHTHTCTGTIYYEDCIMLGTGSCCKLFEGMRFTTLSMKDK